MRRECDELDELAEELRRVCAELEELLDAGMMSRLDVTARLQRICRLARRREGMLLARKRLEGGVSYVD